MRSSTKRTTRIKKKLTKEDRILQKYLGFPFSRKLRKKAEMEMMKEVLDSKYSK
ncbi:MAG: hypothetical protein HMLIMOIP_001579 [Candidatus Nitrosomirales archaeon]|jgi:hypothetical protein